MSVHNCDNNGCNSCLSIVSTRDSQSIDLTGCGTPASPLYGTVILSNQDGNILEIRSDGLYAACCGGGSGEGGAISIVDSITIDFSGDGTEDNPITGDVILSSFPGNSLSILSDGLYDTNTIESGVVYGGIVTWLQDYDYYVSPSGYYINGIFYESPGGFFTLSAPDLLDNRLDTFIVDTDGNTSVLEGTPSSNPAQAALDPSLQLELSIALVEVGTTQPTLATECAYRNNIEWGTVVSAATLNPDYLGAPCSGAKAIKGTGVVTGNNIQLTRSSAFNPSTNHSQLVMLLRSDAWISVPNNYLRFQWTLAGVPVLIAVDIKDGVYNFDADNGGTCQIVAIPLAVFGFTSLSSVDGLKITANAVSGTLNFTLDDICLQGQPVVAFPLDTDEKAKVSANDTVPGYLNGKLVAGTGITFTENNDGANETLTISSSVASVLTFDNGLTRTLDNTQLGGTLLHDTALAHSVYKLTHSSSTLNDYLVEMFNTQGTGGGLYATSLAGIAVNASSDDGFAVNAISTGLGSGVNASTVNAYAVIATATGLGGGIPIVVQVANSFNNDISTAIRITKQAGGGVINGAGLRITYESDPGTYMGYLDYVWDIAGSDSRYDIYNSYLGSVQRKFSVGATGLLTADNYGGGTFSGTPTYWLATNAGGDIIEVAAPSGSGIVTADNGLSINPTDNVQLGGSLLQDTVISNGGFQLDILGNSSVYTFGVDNNGTGAAIDASAVTTAVVGVGGDIGGDFQSTNGLGVNAGSANSYGAIISTNEGDAAVRLSALPASTNTVQRVIEITRQSSGTPANGIGASIDFFLEAATIGSFISNQIITKWTNATTASRTSQFIITGVNNAVTADLLTLSGSGALQLNKYGINTFAGSAAYILGVDASGNVIETALGTGGLTAITANNGLSVSTVSNTQLGGSPLLFNTSITTSAFSLTIPSSNATGTLSVTNSSASGYSVQGFSTTGPGVIGRTGGSGQYGIWGIATNAGYAVRGDGTTGSSGVWGSQDGGSYGVVGEAVAAATNSILPAFLAQRLTTGTAATGIGTSIDYRIETTNGLSNLAAREKVSYTDAIQASRTADYTLSLYTGGVESDRLTLNSAGAFRLHAYGVGTFTGTETYFLASDASGNIIEIAPGAMPGGSSITADNGLTMSTATNAQLGGTLLNDTTIATSTFELELSGTNALHILGVTNVGSGTAGAFVADNATGTGITGSGALGGVFTGVTGVTGITTTNAGLGGTFSGTFTTTATKANVIDIQRNTTGTAAAGLGASIQFTLETTTSSVAAGSLGFVWRDAATASASSAFEVVTINNAITGRVLSVENDGLLILDSYGAGTMTAGVATFSLSVDANGNVVETAIGTGMTNPMNAKGDLITSNDGAGTPVNIAAGPNGFVLTSNGAGTLPTWQAAGGASGITRSRFSVSSNTTMGAAALTDYLYFVSGTTTVTLPTAVGNTNRYTVFRTDSTLTTTVATTGGQTINGSSTITLTSQYESVDLVSNNSQWFII